MSQDSTGRYYEGAETDTTKALSSAARTASGTGTAFTVEDVTDIEGTLTISAASGTTPTLDVRLETTVDGTNYYTVGSFSQKTTTGSEARAFGPLGQLARWAWTVGGTTPSFTFAITAKVDRDRG
jgi:hypothetical protein